MTSIVETLTVALVAGGLVAGGVIVGTETTSGADLAALAGISEPVYECAEAHLDGRTTDQLQALIDDIETGTPNSDIDALALCVQADPFGWAGTDQEWALALLHDTDPAR